MDYEIGKLRALNVLAYPHIDFDATYTVYYDETNNFRKLNIRVDGFNNPLEKNFVLGGVFYSGERPDINDIFDFLKMPPGQTEVKFKTIAKGDFLTCLTSTKLQPILTRVLSSDLYFHYFSLNYLYWSLVDIVDSAINCSGFNSSRMQPFANGMKEALYVVCKQELGFVQKLFYQYKYPNIKKEDVRDFCENLIELIEAYQDDADLHFSLMTLKGLIQGAMKNNELTFLHGNEDLSLIDTFIHFYLAPIYRFSNSEHILDIEKQIQEQLDDITILNNGVPLENYKFIDSQSDILIQISDVLVGLFGKMTGYTNTHEIEEIKSDYTNLTPLQKSNLELLIAIIDKTDKENAGFLHNVNSVSEVRKVKFLQDLASHRN